MGERKGTNHYYPPDFDPAKHRSLNGYWGTHALRERARKLDKGILIIRFEMPFNCWCLTCNKPIGMGVRYNAEKTKVGMYYSTPIYKFKMRCAMCAGDIEIQTDPQNYQYVIVSGARRKEQRWDVEDSGQIVPETRDTQKRLALDAMFNLEHTVEDRKKIADAVPSLERIEERRDKLRDDFGMNQAVRHLFRTEKKARQQDADADAAFLARHSLQGGAVRLLPTAAKDERGASLLRLRSARAPTQKKDEEQERGEAIFGTLGAPTRKRKAAGGLGVRLVPKKIAKKTEENAKEEKEDSEKNNEVRKEEDCEDNNEVRVEEDKVHEEEDSLEDCEEDNKIREEEDNKVREEGISRSSAPSGLLGLSAYSDSSDSDGG